MPAIILLIIFVIWGAVDLYDSCSKKALPYNQSDLDNILSQTVGKSKREAKTIVRKYHRR